MTAAQRPTRVLSVWTDAGWGEGPAAWLTQGPRGYFYCLLQGGQEGSEGNGCGVWVEGAWRERGGG